MACFRFHSVQLILTIFVLFHANNSVTRSFTVQSNSIWTFIGQTSEWDTGAAQIIVEEAGGALLDFYSGEPLVYNKEIMVNPDFIASGKFEGEHRIPTKNWKKMKRVTGIGGIVETSLLIKRTPKAWTIAPKSPLHPLPTNDWAR